MVQATAVEATVAAVIAAAAMAAAAAAEFRVQSLFEPTNGKPTKLAL